MLENDKEKELEKNKEKEEKEILPEDQCFNDLTKDLIQLIQGKTGIAPLISVRQEPIVDKKAETAKVKEKTEIQFELTPKQVKDHLDRYVIKQEEAKKVLSVAICDHFNHVKFCQKNGPDQNYQKQNIVIIGPSGVGKTYLIKCIADLIGVPFVRSDATKYSETGYMGGDVEDLVRQLVKRADGDISLAEYGIIYLDEVDKITASKDSNVKDVSGKGVQSNLLKLLEETNVPLNPPWDIQSQMKGFLNAKKSEKETINTKNILFIMSGAFQSLEDIIRKRVEGSKYGFNRQVIESDKMGTMYQSTTNDFINYGFEPEFIGRVPVRVFCEELTAKDLFYILKNAEASIIKQYVQSFSLYDIDIWFTDAALERIAEIASEQKTGARGLVTVCEKIFRHYKFELPSTSVKKFLVTDYLIDHPEDQLAHIINHPDIASQEYQHYLVDQGLFVVHQSQARFS